MAKRKPATLVLAFAFAFAFVASSVSADCPVGFSENVATGKCYRLIAANLTQSDASDVCRTFGSNVILATVHSFSDKEFIKTMCGPFPCWISLTRKPGTLCQAADAS